jgi:hypothetical protein
LDRIDQNPRCYRCFSQTHKSKNCQLRPQARGREGFQARGQDKNWRKYKEEEGDLRKKKRKSRKGRKKSLDSEEDSSGAKKEQEPEVQVLSTPAGTQLPLEISQIKARREEGIFEQEDTIKLAKYTLEGIRTEYQIQEEKRIQKVKKKKGKGVTEIPRPQEVHISTVPTPQFQGLSSGSKAGSLAAKEEEEGIVGDWAHRKSMGSRLSDNSSELCATPKVCTLFRIG